MVDVNGGDQLFDGDGFLYSVGLVFDTSRPEQDGRNALRTQVTRVSPSIESRGRFSQCAVSSASSIADTIGAVESMPAAGLKFHRLSEILNVSSLISSSIPLIFVSYHSELSGMFGRYRQSNVTVTWFGTMFGAVPPDIPVTVTVD